MRFTRANLTEALRAEIGDKPGDKQAGDKRDGKGRTKKNRPQTLVLLGFAAGVVECALLDLNQ